MKVRINSDFSSFLIKGATFFSGILVSFLISNYRGSEDLGVFELFMGVINLTSVAFLSGSNVLFLKEIKEKNWSEFLGMSIQSLVLTILVGLLVLLVMYVNGSLNLFEGAQLFTIVILGYLIKLGATLLQGSGSPHLIFIGDNNFSNIVFSFFASLSVISVNFGILLAKIVVLLTVLILVKSVFERSALFVLEKSNKIIFRNDLILSGAFFFAKSLCTTGLLVVVSFKAELIDIGIIGVLIRLASLSGLGLLIFSMSYSVRIASSASVNEISDGLKSVRLKSTLIAIFFLVMYQFFGGYALSKWGVSSDMKIPLLLLVFAQILNSGSGPIGIIMAKYGQFLRLILYTILSLAVFVLSLFGFPGEDVFLAVSIGVVIMQLLENLLKLNWWNSHKKTLI